MLLLGPPARAACSGRLLGPAARAACSGSPKAGAWSHAPPCAWLVVRREGAYAYGGVRLVEEKEAEARDRKGYAWRRRRRRALAAAAAPRVCCGVGSKHRAAAVSVHSRLTHTTATAPERGMSRALGRRGARS